MTLPLAVSRHRSQNGQPNIFIINDVDPDLDPHSFGSVDPDQEV